MIDAELFPALAFDAAAYNMSVRNRVNFLVRCGLSDRAKALIPKIGQPELEVVETQQKRQPELEVVVPKIKKAPRMKGDIRPLEETDPDLAKAILKARKGGLSQSRTALHFEVSRAQVQAIEKRAAERGEWP